MIFHVFRVRPAHRLDAALLQAVERLAGQPFRGVGLTQVADDEPLTLEELERYAERGHGWVVLGESDDPVGYVVVSEVDGRAHIDQMSVRPDHQGQGAGRLLVDRVRAWALETERAGITLTTYADVAWNRPLYEHLGFRVLNESEIGSELLAIREAERERGLDRRPRVCMYLDLERPSRDRPAGPCGDNATVS